MKLYNTFGRKLIDFTPIHEGEVRMYNCGPTVYDYPHIGNWRTFTLADILKRVLLFRGYKVMQVMNITDVGHLVSDEDEGEDKLEKGAKREKKTVWEVAQYYIDDFLASREILHILPPDALTRATDNIPEQIAMIEKIITNGYAYVTKEAVYFDVDAYQRDFKDYTSLSGQKLEDQKVGVRDGVVVDKEKKHPYDFRLWQLDDPDHQMLWDSPWGKGYPGWHIECSAMSTKFLGQPFDIHTGGVDHIPVHHSDEIAQAQAANRTKFVNVWMHGEFLTIEGGRMGKSLGNYFTVQDIEKMVQDKLGYSTPNAALSLRYLYLTSHYRNKLDFSQDSLIASFFALFDIYKAFGDLYLMHKDELNNYDVANHVADPDLKSDYQQRLIDASDNDLDTSRMIADLNLLIADSSILTLEKAKQMLEYDKILGFGMLANAQNHIFNYTNEQEFTMQERKAARENRDYAASDTIREKLEKTGIEVLDRKERSIYYRR